MGKLVDVQGNEIKTQQTVDMYNVLGRSNIIKRIRHLLAPQGPMYIDPHTQKITMQNILLSIKPWVNIHYEKKPKSKFCTLDKDMLFDCFNMHPSYCKEVCWKVVVHPLTYHDLIILLEIFREYGRESKVGIEERDYVPHNYGGYLYLYDDEGLSKLRLIKKDIQDLVHAKFTQPVDVVLKRGCTEMEEKFGPSKQWRPITDAERKYENYVKSFFDIPRIEKQPPDLIDFEIMENWMRFAWSIGDRTVDAYNNGKPLVNTKIDYY